MHDPIPAARPAIDYAIGASGISSPAWLPAVHNISDIAAACAAIGGAVLVTIRIGLALLEWRQKRGRS